MPSTVELLFAEERSECCALGRWKEFVVFAALAEVGLRWVVMLLQCGRAEAAATSSNCWCDGPFLIVNSVTGE